jgi:hypothetical protein
MPEAGDALVDRLIDAAILVVMPRRKVAKKATGKKYAAVNVDRYRAGYDEWTRVQFKKDPPGKLRRVSRQMAAGPCWQLREVRGSD